jgi:carbonic anhydrase
VVGVDLEAKAITLHGWHYVIEDGEVHVFDVKSGAFLPASTASHSGTGPYHDPEEVMDSVASPVFNEIDDSYAHR